ncbi:hypothetical protein [Alloscardovia criceti]|uniref:hypothetical protein n=1 Tax=Alloscardovia criceti TaxID=356828 RepID=UPI000366E605|nr:hypothetical protein [Alloscardovia criceti]
MARKPPMEPEERTCEQCGKPFVVTSRRQLKKRFCSDTCRKYNNTHTHQMTNNRARDFAYTQLTLKDLERESRMRSILEKSEQLENTNQALRNTIDDMTLILTRMVTTGYLAVNENSPSAHHWHAMLNSENQNIDWKEILSSSADGYNPYQQGGYQNQTTINKAQPSVSVSHEPTQSDPYEFMNDGSIEMFDLE